MSVPRLDELKRKNRDLSQSKWAEVLELLLVEGSYTEFLVFSRLLNPLLEDPVSYTD